MTVRLLLVRLALSLGALGWLPAAELLNLGRALHQAHHQGSAHDGAFETCGEDARLHLEPARHAEAHETACRLCQSNNSPVPLALAQRGNLAPPHDPGNELLHGAAGAPSPRPFAPTSCRGPPPSELVAILA